MKIKLYMDYLILLTLIVLMPCSGRAQYTDTTKTHKLYYGNGQVKQISHQGIFNGCGVPAGTDSTFTEDARLYKTINYRHSIVKNGTCADIVTKQIVTTYYSSGKKRTVQQFSSTYEGEQKRLAFGSGMLLLGKLFEKKHIRIYNKTSRCCRHKKPTELPYIHL